MKTKIPAPPTARPTGHVLKKRGGFTLVELLTVMAIVAVLAGILVASISRVRTSAKSAQCVSNLRQIGVAVTSYAAEHKQNFPTGGWAGNPDDATDPGIKWIAQLYPYLGSSRDAFVCPEGTPTSPINGSAYWVVMPPPDNIKPSPLNRYPAHYAYNALLNMNAGHVSKNDGRSVDKTINVRNLPGLPVMIDIVWQDNFLGFNNVFNPTPTPNVGQSFAARHNDKGNVLWGDGHVSSHLHGEWAAMPDQRAAAHSANRKDHFCTGNY